ncbi:hypothetical protein LZ32DRAFT_329764 [Colletotrichum eremochloae]|nr:hypothetical protein LZ32DRAFT_329764 [Colletotrichum eremochloae]
MSVWVAKIIQIGDIAVQNSPTSATLPWAIFKFLMKVSMNDVETFGYIMESVERIAHFVAVSTVLELQYLHSQEKKFRVSDQIEKTIKGLYVAILQYLAQVTHYLQHNTVTRFLKSVIVPKEEIESNFQLYTGGYKSSF